MTRLVVDATLANDTLAAHESTTEHADGQAQTFHERSRSPPPFMSSSGDDDIEVLDTSGGIEAACWSLISDRRIRPAIFKVGISHHPPRRWYGEYFFDGYARMYIVFEHDQPEPVEDMERCLISELTRRSDATGRPDRPRCQNQQPGGEGCMRLNPPPYYTYLVVGDGIVLGRRALVN